MTNTKRLRITINLIHVHVMLIGIRPSFFIASLLFLSCTNSFQETSVSFPERMLRIEGGYIVDDQDKDRITPSVIIHYGKNDCSVCAAEKLWKSYRSILENKELYNGVAVILSPEKEQLSLISHIVKSKQYSFPVFIDSLDVFSQNNAPITQRYRILILNKSGQLLYATNSVNNLKLKRIIKNVSSNEGQVL